MPAENAGRAFAVVLVDELVRQGMRHAVVAPGSRSTPIALALLENEDVTVHVRIDERSAAYLALGIAKASRTVVPVLCTSGTAASYFHGAVMEADLSSVSLLVLTADRPPELHGIGANQTVAQQDLYGAAVRWAPVLETPASAEGSVAAWRALAAEAVARCASGPVHLNLPLREPLVAVDDGIGFPYDLDERTESSPAPAPASPGVPVGLVRHMSGARRGVVVAGGWSTDDVDPVLSFAERVGWPVIAEPHSNARSGPMALRATDAVLRDPEFVAAHQPDVVLVIGRVGLSRVLLSWLETVPHVVLSPDGHHWDVTRSALDVIAAPVSSLDVCTQKSEPGWAEDWLAAAASAGAAIDDVLDSEGALSEPLVARSVAELVPSGGTLVVSSSMPIRDLDIVMVPRPDFTLFANRGVSGIDGFVSTAVGIATARAGTPTIALCGDLSLLHDVNGLMLGPEPRPDLTLVVINNDGGGIFSLLPQGSAVAPEAFERVFGTPHGVDIAKVASTYDVPHSLVSTLAELTGELASYDGLKIIEVRTDRAANKALHDQLRKIGPRSS